MPRFTIRYQCICAGGADIKNLSCVADCATNAGRFDVTYGVNQELIITDGLIKIIEQVFEG